MVFSFFKKKDKLPEEKMPERAVARPKPLLTPANPVSSVTPAKSAGLPELEFTTSHRPLAVPPPLAPAQPEKSGKVARPATKPWSREAVEPDFTISEFERNFTESSVMAINVDDGDDPVQADVEEVAVLFANGQYPAARTLLQNFVRTYQGEPAQRFWLMYFDLLQLMGERAAFDRLTLEFVQQQKAFPPPWRAYADEVNELELPRNAYYLKGDLLGTRFDELKAIFDKYRLPVLDFSLVRRMDFYSAGQLANRVGIFRHGGREIVIRSPNHLVAELMGVVGINKYARILVPIL